MISDPSDHLASEDNAVHSRHRITLAADKLSEARKTIASQTASGAKGLQTFALQSDLIDGIVLSVYKAITDELPLYQLHLLEGRVALVALGGYGRREMAPFSDIDLMVLHDGTCGDVVPTVARRLVQDLFDAGLQVGQSVRTSSEACRLSICDATILSSVLDARLLAGNAVLFERLMQRHARMISRRRRMLAQKIIHARTEERMQFGETVSLLEPNIKRSPGALRDIQLVHWIGAVIFGESTMEELVFSGAISKSDADLLRAADEFLSSLRIDLHLSAGRSNDVLTREEQVRIAQQRGITSRAGLLGVERFMQEYFLHTRHVMQVLEYFLERSLPSGRIMGWLTPIVGHRVERIYCVGPDRIAAAVGQISQVAGSLQSILRLLELSLIYDRPVDGMLWRTIRSTVSSLPCRLDDQSADRFLSLMRGSNRLADTLRKMHEIGLLQIIIPQFEHARHLLQFNNYHKYTVDEHCIHAVEKAIECATDPGWLGDVWRELKRKRPLLIALLIHDLGKGFIEDHSEVGLRIAGDVCSRLHVPAAEQEIVEYLVHKHLAMAHLAFRRDTGDDSLVIRFAVEVGSPEILRMMTLLTVADVSAVGPGTWNRWKSDLLAELYFRALGYLDGESPFGKAQRNRQVVEDLLVKDPPDQVVLRMSENLPLSYLHDTAPERLVAELKALAGLAESKSFVTTSWDVDNSTLEITVGTRENVATGIFHRLTGALTSQRLEILSADIHTLKNGFVLDHFVVQDPDFSGQPSAERCETIREAIFNSLESKKPPTFPKQWKALTPPNLTQNRLPPRVKIDEESSDHSTIVEVFAHDSLGLLYRIALAIFEAGLSVRAAKIGTYLDQVVDAFHVTDTLNSKVIDPVKLNQLRQSLERIIAEDSLEDA